ncbi:MAG: hypothetical protein KA792_04305 [Bacteroidales bacterium]|nr:hypothetical protein [Bacteroidales bacterium]
MKIKPLLKLSIIFIIPFLFLECATIVSKSSYPINIKSNPEGAKFIIFNKKMQEIYQGKTPATINLKSGAGYFSKASYIIDFSLEGYKSEKAIISSSLNGWYFGNLLLGGLLGILIIDPLTGAMWKIDTKYIDVTLNYETYYNNYIPQLRIYNINEIPEEWKQLLISIK